jgi:hypothetical protein
LWVLRLKLPSAPSKNSTLFEYQTNATSAQEILGLFFLQKPKEVFISTQGSKWTHSILLSLNNKKTNCCFQKTFLFQKMDFKAKV